MGGVCVLAYSGGLDTSVSIPWIRERGYEVVALTVDVGQGEDLDAVRERALACGAREALVVDAREEFARDFVLPALRANALYEGKYPLVSALSRPLIARHLARVAREVGAGAVAHGCTGKGNDQVRFEVSLAALAPDLEVLAPIRDSEMSREKAMAYAAEKGVPVPATPSAPYSIDENLWGRAAEAGVLEDPWEAPPARVFAITADPERAPDAPEELVISFREGTPASLDGRELPLADLIRELTGRAGAHGVGRVDMVENRRVGIKSREVYEVPAAQVLIAAHRDLEDLTLERDLAHFKADLEPVYARLVYDGLWFSPLREALDAFFAKTQEPVTGEVRVRLYKGSCQVVGRRSPNSLYDPSLATYGSGDAFRHADARGYVSIYGLPLRVWARRRRP